MNINPSLREARQSRELSLQKLGQLIGISYPTLSRVECGKQNPGSTLRNACERELGAIDWLQVEPCRMKSCTKYEAEQQFKVLLEMLYGMDDRDRINFTKMITKYLKGLKHLTKLKKSPVVFGELSLRDIKRDEEVKVDLFSYLPQV